MRALFLLLLLANVAFFAWSRYVAPRESTADPRPLARQIDPEKLKLISPSALPPPAPKPPPPAAAAPAAAQPSTLACLEWGSFAPGDPRPEQVLAPLGLGERLSPRRTVEVAGWWVFMPPQGSRQGAQRKAGELKDLGVREFFIVQEEGPYRWALSLGVFRTEEAAQGHLAELRKRGVRTARVGARETVVPKVWLQVSGVDAQLESRLRETASQIEGSELRPCS